MLTVSGISKSYGSKVLFEDASIQINRGDRLGLVGPNGAGKTTLLSIILGTESPDTGGVSLERGVRLGHLPQESCPVGEQTVLQIALSGADWHNKSEDVHSDSYHDSYSFETEPKAKRILAGLAFREKDFDRPARELSGGWVMRAHLARLLTDEPDLLILDEPTNHLDLESLQWFQDYLNNYPGAIMMISHDREFLNQLVTTIVEIRQSSFHRYRGNYEDYLQQKAANEINQAAAYKNQQREIARLQLFADRFRAKNTKAAQAQSKLKQIERMDKIEAPESDDKTIHFSFPQPQRSGLKVVTLANVHHAYGTNVIYRGIDFEAERGQRMVLVGPNGSGKSTLLKILAGVLEFQSGTRTLGHNVKAGYYSQYRADVLDVTRTVLEEAMETPQRVTEQYIRTVLGAFLFRGDDVFKRISVLSGGEKSRLALVKLLLDPPNLLLMDEPTTHLDMASIDALVAAMEQYQGTVVFISHDVYFIRKLASHVVHIAAGKLTHFAGAYQYYIDKSAAQSDRSALVAPEIHQGRTDSQLPREKQPAKTKEQKRLEAEERQQKSRERRDQQQRVDALEKKISNLETRRKELTQLLEAPETYQTGKATQINRELLSLEDELAVLNHNWEKASTQLLQFN